jgi:hypothetical protein
MVSFLRGDVVMSFCNIVLSFRCPAGAPHTQRLSRPHARALLLLPQETNQKFSGSVLLHSCSTLHDPPQHSHAQVYEPNMIQDNKQSYVEFLFTLTGRHVGVQNYLSEAPSATVLVAITNGAHWLRKNINHKT